jgi:hypothetical protein
MVDRRNRGDHGTSPLTSTPIWLTIVFGTVMLAIWIVQVGRWLLSIGLSWLWSILYALGVLCPAAWFAPVLFGGGWGIGIVLLLQIPIPVSAYYLRKNRAQQGEEPNNRITE